MSTSLEEVRAALSLYISDKTGTVELPEHLLELLEDADESSRYRAEQIEGILALYAGNKISRDVLRDRLQDLTRPNRIQIGAALVLGDAAYDSPIEGPASFGQMRILREEEYA